MMWNCKVIFHHGANGKRQNAPRADPGEDLECTLAIADATSLTEAGWWVKMLKISLETDQAADYDVEKQRRVLSILMRSTNCP